MKSVRDWERDDVGVGVMGSLFTDSDLNQSGREDLAPGAVLLRAYAAKESAQILLAIAIVAERAPFRHMTTPGGFTMSVAMTNCGDWGWVTDRHGYRYSQTDPENKTPWPGMPRLLRSLAMSAALDSGFPEFIPDACLINRYEPGAKMSLHQDKDERDFGEPIVSVSLGIPAVFQFGGFERSDEVRRIPLMHGDVVVWGGPSRLRYHGILPIKQNTHPLAGPYRINLTFRRAT